MQWLAQASEAYVDDPLEKFIGAFNSNMPGWSERHDEYLGEALMREMRGDTDGTNPDA